MQRFFKQSLSACVLDSCPGELTVQSGIDALASSLKPGTFCARHAATLAKAFHVACWAILLSVFYKRFYDTLCEPTIWNWNCYYRDDLAPLAAIASLVAIFFLPLFFALWGSSMTRRYFSGVASTDGIPSPWLVVYGDADRVIAPHDVQHVMQLRRANGGHVESHCFAGARHVQLLRTHPEKYKSVVKDFVVKHLRTD